jgi:peptidoglycan/xylan/chitin deacetylase (PgdA/CDA1 family)
MSFYQVERPEQERLGTYVPEIAAAAVLVVAVIVIVFAAFATVPVLVDGVRHDLPLNAPVDDVLALDLTDASPGDLVAAADGRVLREGAGRPIELRVDGRPARAGERIVGPVEVTSLDGEDVVEDVVVTEELIAIPVRYQGEGPLVSLTQTGNVGKRRVERGATSGQVLAMTVVQEAAPMVFTRERTSPGDRVVALTFDDGPWPGQTEAVLEILDAKEVKATFFLLGVQVRKHPELARAVAAGGHLIGNHTYGHSMLRYSTKQQVREEIVACRDAIRAAVGITPTWFRPPGGLLSPSVHAVCAEKGMQVVGWTVDPQDWSGKSARQLVEEVVSATEPGAVVLLHDGGGDRRATIDALSEIIDRLRSRGFQFIRLDETPDMGLSS